MSKIPLPDRGQPLDVPYIASMANAINDLQNEVSRATYHYTSIDKDQGGSENIKTSDARIVAGFIAVYATSTSVTAAQVVPFSYTLPNDFKYRPIVTATPINIGNTPAGEDVTVTLKSVTTSRIDGSIKFNTAGNVSVGINLIAIGIPN